MPRLCEVYLGIRLTTEEKHGNTAVRVAVFYIRILYIILILYISLYSDLLEDVDLSQKHVGGFMCMDNLLFYCVHMSMYINDCKHKARNE